MSLWDEIIVTSPDGDETYEEGVDYEIDYEGDTIKRIDSGGIPDGGEVTVRYVSGVPGGMLASLQSNGSAVARPAKAIVAVLQSAKTILQESTEFLSEKVTRLELRQSLGSEPDELEIDLNDPTYYAACDPSDDVCIAAAIGDVDENSEEHYTECFRGLVTNREVLSDADGVRGVRLTVRDFSISLDAPRQEAMGRTWHPRLRREVFRNGKLIADDYRDIKSSSIYDDFSLDDVVEIHFAKEYPGAHQVIRDCFEAGDMDFLDTLSIDCLDFPVVYIDGRNKTPGQVIREIASLAGASVSAEGNTLVISERGFPGGYRTAWVYDALAIYGDREFSKSENTFTAVQIFGHAETSRLPTKSVYLPPTDFTKPGWVRVIDEEGTLEPSEPFRTDEIPQPAELNFQLDGDLYDPYWISVLGGELASRPEVTMVDGNKVINVRVLIQWAVDDKTGECPYIEDEDGNKLFRIHGKVYDAIPTPDGIFEPIPHAIVTRERLDGATPGDLFIISANSQGYYYFEAVPLGSYKILAEAPGYLDNFEDDDPGNDEYRDLSQELIDYENELEEGRYEKRATDYHVIVWAKPKIDMGPLADLTVSMVLLEVRDSETQSGKPLVYGPTIRDERITTEVLARRIGQALLAESKASSPSIELRLPLNRWLRAGDGIRITGADLDLSLPDSRPFQATSVRKIIEPEKCLAYDIVTSAPARVGAMMSRGFREDPLDTKVGAVIAVYRNELGGRVYDVAASGRILYGLKAGPLLGELGVGETVQIARASSGALSYMIVARTTEIFGSERICYV